MVKNCHTMQKHLHTKSIIPATNCLTDHDTHRLDISKYSSPHDSCFPLPLKVWNNKKILP